MNFKKWRSPKLILFLILPLLLGYYANVQANINRSKNKLAGQQVLSQKPSPLPQQKPSQQSKRKPISIILPNEGAPGNRKGADTRGPCANDKNKPNLTALIPGKLFGLTITERPTFWFYVPYQANSKTPVEFTLTDKQEKEIYQENLLLTNTPGVIGVTIPANVSALEVDQIYEWKLSVTCSPVIDTVSGRIKRVKASAEVMSQLQASRGRSRIIIYAENGFWYDTLTGLIELRRQNPQDEGLKTDWQDLLKPKEIGLENIVSEPIVSCCKSK
ncbi:DUF928 domain-containing protein [Nostoc sphaeroides]|uniref:DUF928 domain-containing protein n=1 Tax=Nostoc sphaeroides CCNUC1 TaxID=2653204 RepID=A0A5P8WI74_9NOSO|nr:DUF928 domain-containing protein [Nostoc sphaeroides]MCC5633072.1 DUF928 domain-containing protein [Nostoc sphaeroides CHAB 2801]QFS51519.1 hypothetical protein GXM_09013 [Nostoc sphaeroides CCNUC1]